LQDSEMLFGLEIGNMIRNKKMIKKTVLS